MAGRQAIEDKYYIRQLTDKSSGVSLTPYVRWLARRSSEIIWLLEVLCFPTVTGENYCVEQETYI